MVYNELLLAANPIRVNKFNLSLYICDRVACGFESRVIDLAKGKNIYVFEIPLMSLFYSNIILA